MCVIVGGEGTRIHLISGPQSGMLSSLPHISGCVCIILGGLLADFLLSRKILRLIVIRKLFTTIGEAPTDTGVDVRNAGSPLFILFLLYLRGPWLLCGPRVSVLGQIQPRCHHHLLHTDFCLHQLQSTRVPHKLLGYCSSVWTPLPHSYQLSAGPVTLNLTCR